MGDYSDFTENKTTIYETLTFIHETLGLSDHCGGNVNIILKHSPSDWMCSLFIVKVYFHHPLTGVHLYRCFACLDISKYVSTIPVLFIS